MKPISNSISNQIIPEPWEYRIVVSRVVVHRCESDWYEEICIYTDRIDIVTDEQTQYTDDHIPGSESYKGETEQRRNSKKMNNPKRYPLFVEEYIGNK